MSFSLSYPGIQASKTVYYLQIIAFMVFQAAPLHGEGKKGGVGANPGRSLTQYNRDCIQYLSQYPIDGNLVTQL